MPVLMKWPLGRRDAAGLAAIADGNTGAAYARDLSRTMGATNTASILPRCGNAGCRSGWMRLWRNRQSPVLEGKWACSQACMREMVQAAILREASEQNLQRVTHRHRVPLGLVLLSRGVITQEQLRRALEAQKRAGKDRLGEWLIRQGSANEEQVARGLSSQWNCPVLSSAPHDPAAMAAVFPRLMIDSFGAIPLRLAGGQLLYVAFEDRIDRCLVLAAERMLGFKVEAGVLHESDFRSAQREMLRAVFPKTRLLEAVNIRGLVHAFTGMIEEKKPARSQIVRVHDYFWLRMWRNPSGTETQSRLPPSEEVEDMVCSLTAGG